MKAPPISNHTVKRKIIAFPDVENFYDILQDRLNYVLSRYNFLTEKYTVFINALPRKVPMEINRFEQVLLNYAGVRMQRMMLESKNANPQTEKYWRALEEMELTSESGIVSSELYKKFRNGEYGLDNIIESAGSLYNYFNLHLPEEERVKQFDNKGQLYEYHILRNNVDIFNYRYFSLPLIQFGEFDGVVHIVYSEDDHQRILDSDPNGNGLRVTIANMIKSFSSLYEGIILDWELVGSNADKETAVRAALDQAIDPVFFETFNNNPILKELAFQDFYRKHEQYYLMRFEQTDSISFQRRQQYRKIAIMSILIDSYAHNVTAHSLTALEWWFRLRAEGVRRYGKENYSRFADEYAYLPVVAKDSLAIELYPLMKFLLDKGAFWTGLTRERSFGGKTSSFFNILWYDFINNPLYLGTIAFSEGILKLNINIVMLKEVSHEHKAYYKKQVLVDEDGVALDGNFVSVDLNQLSSFPSNGRPEKISDFVIPSEKFPAFEKALKKANAFFPGGVVGRHAFFTILENEIRNVKHYPKEAIEEMQQNGLTITISIEESTYRKGKAGQNGKMEYFKLGVWINHPILLTQELIEKRIVRLGEDIIDDDSFKPKLGGTFQDKVCAAMLFNNTFTSVQDQSGLRNKRFYPWMKVGGSFLDEQENVFRYDYELTWRRFTDDQYIDTKQYFNQHFKKGKGYFKKFFHIWKGEDIYNLDNEDEFSSIYENYSRFRFVSMPIHRQDLFCEVRKEGVIRTIHENVNDLTNAYRLWLKNWLKPQDKNYRVKFSVNGQPAGHLFWDGSKTAFLNRKALKQVPKEERSVFLDEAKTHTQEIHLVHGNSNMNGKSITCRYRNHGMFKQYFLNGAELNNATMEEALASELLEVLATRVGIFDNRIANRVEKGVNLLNLEKGLNCRIFKEDITTWNYAKTSCLPLCHILVVHLSFIESFRDEEGNKIYSEDNINDFIQQEIIQFRERPSEDFILVLTTGRGRTQWWRSLEKDGGSYACFTTFRPVESLIDSIENAINMEDDFELKYRLVKVLFGS